MRRIIAMPAVERLLFALGAIVIVMMAMTSTLRQPHPAGTRDWAAVPPPAVNADADDPNPDRFLGVFAR
jgi:hypothetical protein